MFRIPYRWLPRTTLRNLASMYRDFVTGVRNVIRWIPVIWFDQDWDWCYLASIMGYKFGRMSKALKQGVLVNRHKHSRQLLICAELCRRMNDEHGTYYANATKRFPDKGKNWAKMISDLSDADEKMLAKLIGKHLRYWWD